MVDPIEQITRAQAKDMENQARNARQGNVSTYTCPECGGSLWQVDEKELIRFRCHVGHVYNGEALLAEQSANLEAALWTAVRTFKEKCVLAHQLAESHREKGREEAARRFEEEGCQADRYSMLIQQYLTQGLAIPEEKKVEGEKG